MVYTAASVSGSDHPALHQIVSDGVIIGDGRSFTHVFNGCFPNIRSTNVSKMLKLNLNQLEEPITQSEQLLY